MDFFQVSAATTKEQWLFGGLFIGLKLIIVFVNKQNSLLQSIVGFQTSVELNSIIFEKLLKESPSGTQEKVAEGKIVNYFQIDSQKLGYALLQSPNLLTIPIQIILQILLLFKYIGISGLAGVGTLIIFLGFNAFLEYLFQKLEIEFLKKKDERMKYTSETFNSLKILKLYAWDEEYFERVIT